VGALGLSGAAGAVFGEVRLVRLRPGDRHEGVAVPVGRQKVRVVKEVRGAVERALPEEGAARTVAPQEAAVPEVPGGVERARRAHAHVRGFVGARRPELRLEPRRRFRNAATARQKKPNGQPQNPSAGHHPPPRDSQRPRIGAKR
jgi:hypothetical protein